MPKALIEIKDEINVRFLGVPRDLIEVAKAEVTHYVPGYVHMPTYKMGRWDGRISLMGATGKTYLNLLEYVLPIFEKEGYEFLIEDHRHDWSDVVDALEYPEDTIFSDYKWDDGEPIILRDYQLNAVHTAMNEGQGLLELATGAGKAQPLDAIIMTPTGHMTMGDAAVGDIISTIDGKTTEIVGVFPQGEKTLYEIEFQDGRVVECCDEHLWYVRDEQHTDETGLDRFEVLPAKTVKGVLDSNPLATLLVPLTPTHHDEVQLPIDPYIMGIILSGDDLSQSIYTPTSMDSDIIDRVNSFTAQETQQPYLKTALMDAGLDKTLSHTKFIPDAYLYSSLEQRWELIRGLIDSVGYINHKGVASYVCGSQRLAEGIQQLVRSVGGIASISDKPARDSIVYTVSIQVADPTMMVWCKRKHTIARNTQHYDGLSLRIVAIRKVGTASMQCISVADPTRVYITDGYTVTHNTLVCAAISKVYSAHGKVVVIVPNIDLAIQTQALFKRVGLDPGIWYGELKDNRDITISTWQSLDHYPELMAGVVCTIVDEAHQSKGATISKLLSGPGCNVPFRFGCTGTVPKETIWQHQIQGVIGSTIFKLRAWELQQLGVLASAEVIQLVLEDSKNPLYTKAVPFEDWSEQLNWMFMDPKRIETVVSILESMAESVGNVLNLVPYKKHGKLLHECMEGSFSVDGDIKGGKRQLMYKEFGAGVGEVMHATFGVASTGIDIPRIHVLGFTEPGKKFEKVIQTIGRGLRKGSDKDHVIILDICGDRDFSKKHAAERRKLYKEARIPCHVEKIDYANT